MKTSAILPTLTLLLALSASCKKYEFGPYFSLLSKKERIAGAWKVDSAVTRFGVDIGSTFSSYAFDFEKDGSAAFTFQGAGGQQDTLLGKWALEEEKDLFAWSGLLGDTSAFYYTREETFDILQLTNQAFRLADKENTFLYLSPR